MFLNTILSFQETVLNRYLKLDPETVRHLTQISGRVLKIESDLISYYWVFKSDSIYLSKDYNGPIDLTLRGSTFDFIRTALMQKETALTAIPLKVFGDMEFTKQLTELFSNLDIDWEEQLAKSFGDTIAYPVSQFLKTMIHWVKQSVESLGENITDYLQIEMNYLVSEEELQIFLSDVDDLRDNGERLAARINTLQSELNS